MLFASNRGRVGALFGNKFHANQLEAWKMSRKHAWTCAFHYLFAAPVPGVARRFQQEIAALSVPDPLKIGIMIRTGDQDWDIGSFNISTMAGYFHCAKEIEESHIHLSPTRSAVWYLASDHRGLRAAAFRKVIFEYCAGCNVDGHLGNELTCECHRLPLSLLGHKTP